MTPPSPARGQHRGHHQAPTLDEVKGWPATVDVVSGARALGISPSTAYEWIRLGQFPCAVISVRHKHRVVTAGLVELLSQTGRD